MFRTVIAGTVAAGAPEWVEWVGALGGFGSFLLAGGAIYYAWKSAGQADRSAVAAEITARSAEVTAKASQEALAMQRDEHKLLMRRPVLRTTLHLSRSHWEEKTRVLRVSVGGHNSGDTTANDTLVMIALPRVVYLSQVVGGEQGVRHARPSMATQREFHLSAQGTFGEVHSHNNTVSIPPTVNSIEFVDLYFPGPGSYDAVVRLVHHEASGGKAETDYRITIPEEREAEASIEPVGGNPYPAAR